MKRSLRQRIVSLTVVPLILATATALLVVDRQIGRESRTRLNEELSIADAVLGNILATREDDLHVRAEIVARDPKFFALLSIPAEERTPEYWPTLAAIAEEFREATGADLLEVFDARGRYLAGSIRDRGDSSSGGAGSTEVAASEIVAAATADSLPGGTVLVHDGAVYQVATTPVRAGGELVGVLRYGNTIDTALARRVRDLAGADVTFTLNGEIIATSGADEGPVLRRIGAIAWLSGSDHAAYTLTLSLDPELRFLARVRWALLGLGLLFSALAIMIGWSLSVRITRPIGQLLRASERLEQGDYEAPIAVRTGDELESLATTFDGMRQSLHRQIETLATLDQMKSDFLDIASHELRTPASVLRGCIDLLVAAPPAELAPGGDLSDIMDSLAESSHQLARIVEQITDMSLLDRRQMELSMHPVDLGALAREAGEARAGDCAGRHLALTVQTDGGPLPLSADARRVRQVIDNLLLNAIRYTPDGGTVTVRTRAENGSVCCDIEDTGIGIAPEVRERIFEPFFEGRSILGHSSGTVEFNSAGLGTGLAISRRIVEVHGGRIEVDSKPGAGSRFTIRFPRATAVPAVERELCAV